MGVLPRTLASISSLSVRSPKAAGRAVDDCFASLGAFGFDGGGGTSTFGGGDGVSILGGGLFGGNGALAGC